MRTALFVVFAIILILIILYFVFIGKAEKPEPEIVKMEKPLFFVGLEISTSDKAIYKDVGKVAAEFNRIKKINPIPNLQVPWVFVAVSKDYCPRQGTFTYIVGDVVTLIDSIPEGLKSFEIPAITYAVFPIRPKSRIAWGITMGRMKRYIYTKWLPGSGYKPSALIGDFELHDDRSLGKKPEIGLYVGLKDN
jgi:AraC family transcriptional regulator